MKIAITAIIKRQRAHFNIYKNQKKFRNVSYKKSQTLCKKQENFRYVFIYKNQDTLYSTIFHENFEVCIYIQKA